MFWFATQEETMNLVVNQHRSDITADSIDYSNFGKLIAVNFFLD